MTHAWRSPRAIRSALIFGIENARADDFVVEESSARDE